MMRRTILTWICGTIIAACAVSAQAQERGWADQIFEKHEHDFGIVAKGSDVRYRMKLVNKHPDALHIANVGTIGCTCVKSSRPSRDTLAPGEEGAIELSLDTVKFKGQRETTIVVTFDRPAFAEVRIPVKAYIRTDVVLTPGGAEFGAVPQGSSAERRIAIAYLGRPGWNITGVVSKSKHIDAKLAETGRNGPSASYDLVVTLKPSAPVGDFREQVTLVTDDAGSPHIPVLVEARVEAEYSVNPELVDFGTLTPGARKTVNVVFRGRKEFLVTTVESEKSAGTFEVRLPKEPRLIHVLPLTVIAPMEPGVLREELTVTIAGASQPVTFKAQCKVER